MKKTSEYRTKTRLLRIMRALLEFPFHYSKKDLENIYNVSSDVIKDDLKAFKEAGFDYEYNDKYKYGFVADKPFNQLKDLLVFSEKDQSLLFESLDKIAPHSKSAENLKKKIVTFYDMSRTGHPLFRKPYLTKYDILIRAKLEKKKVLLKDYFSSNSNEISDRVVEPFAPSLEDDTLQAYDINKKGLRHFRISRISKIHWLDEDWENEKLHVKRATDPFRIVDDDQIMVHLRLKVGARNELKERFPLTQAYIIQDPVSDDIFDFQCKINHKFLGLSNFILGFHHQIIEVVEPKSLIDHLKQEVMNMSFLEKK